MTNLVEVNLLPAPGSSLLSWTKLDQPSDPTRYRMYTDSDDAASAEARITDWVTSGKRTGVLVIRQTSLTGTVTDRSHYYVGGLHVERNRVVGGNVHS